VELVRPCERNSFRPPVEARHLRRKGTQRGVVLIEVASLRAYLASLPTLAESGLSEFELAVWYGLLVPRGTPRPAIERLAPSMKAASTDAVYLKRLAEFGVQPVPAARSGPDGFAAYFRAEVVKWAPVIKAAGIFAD
jgi:tripartite-type tricarboxylate transporter receptor subunit TctC